MNFLLYFLLLILTWGYYFVVYLHIDWSWFLPSYKNSQYVKQFSDIQEEYDYVIVGGGTAGCVIAHRLSQNTSLKVLLLEAGPLGGPFLDIPGILAHLQLSAVDWKYKTTPQQNAALSFDEARSNWPRGKLLGGTGRLNNMMFIRGHPEDYRKWFPKNSHLQNDHELERFLKYYWKRSESQQGRYQNDTEWHGSDGPLIATDQYYHTNLSTHLEQASLEMNITKRDLNVFHTGFDHPQVNVKNGARYSTGHFLLDQLHDKPNLHLVTHAEVWKINFLDDYEASSIVAVSQKTGETKQVSARHGIILSGGTINTPKILQLSGVGDAKHLSSLGIRTVVDLPEVGRNLRDHIGVGVDLIQLKSSLELNTYTLLNPITIFDYIFRGIGPLTTIECEGMFIGHIDCLLDSTRKQDDFETCEKDLRDTVPDFQVLAAPLGVTTDLGAHLYTTIGLKHSVYNEHYKALHGKPIIMLLTIILHPKSIGYVLIDSPDPSVPPLMNPNYLQHPTDMEGMLKGIRFSQQVVKTPSFQKLGAKFDSRPFPACRMHEYDSDAYWTCFIRHTTLTIYHPIGTAALGTVLDYNFRVKGTSKLFVADASAIPDLASGNPNAMVVALAEIASDYIKHELILSTGFCDILEVFIQKNSLFHI